MHSRGARAHTLVEIIAATALALVLIPAVFPPIDAQVLAVREQFEEEAVRLILEGELERARDEGAKGQLELGTTLVPLDSYGSAGRVDGLRIRRVVVNAGEGALSSVALVAEWRTKAREAAGLELKSWVSSQ
jgi:type II secretory pathway pseudopilin PulG